MLDFLKSRRSVRAFEPRPIAREILSRLVEAATSAPSATNRQPWRFTVVTSASLLEQVARAVRARVEEVKAAVANEPHAFELEHYWNYLHQPLSAAAALVVPQTRSLPDLIERLVESSGREPSSLGVCDRHVEVCATSAATMALILQAHAEGLGACWMTGPLLASEELGRLLRIASPWKPLAVVALGWPSTGGPSARVRKPLSQVVDWLDDAPTPGSNQ